MSERPPPWLTCFFRHRRAGYVVASAAVVDGRITETARILAAFRGQPAANLERWIKSIGGRTEWLP